MPRSDRPPLCAVAHGAGATDHMRVAHFGAVQPDEFHISLRQPSVRERLRLTVVSHPAVTAVNQAPYRELATLGWDVTLIVPAGWRSEWSHSPVVPQMAEGFIGQLVPLPVHLSGSIPLHHYRRGALMRAIVDSRPDVIYAEEEPYAWATFQVGRIAKALGIPFAFYSAQNLHKPYPPPFGGRERWVLRHAALGVAVTGDVAAVLRAKGRSGPICEVPLWVSAAPVRATEAAAVRVRLGTNDRFVVGFAGRLVPEKGIDVLLRAFQTCGIPDATLVVAGSGPLDGRVAEAVGKWAAGPGRGRLQARILGAVPHADMSPLLAAMDVLVLPSLDTAGWSEQFGRVLVEAAAQGVAPIGSRAGWIPRLVAEFHGVCVDQGDPDGLASALRLARHRWGTAGWRAEAQTRRISALRYGVGHVAQDLDIQLRALTELGG